MKLFLWAVIGFVIFWALLLIFALSPARGAVLEYTVPWTGQHHWIDPTQGADSIMVDCSGGDSVSVDSTILVGAPISGGGFRRIRAHYVRGMEGMPDSFRAGPGHYYVLALNRGGVSCAGNIAYVPPPVVTEVPVEPVLGADVIRWKLYDVRGRLAVQPLASGVYYRKEWTKRGVRTRRVVILR